MVMCFQNKNNSLNCGKGKPAPLRSRGGLDMEPWSSLSIIYLMFTHIIPFLCCLQLPSWNLFSCSFIRNSGYCTIQLLSIAVTLLLRELGTANGLFKTDWVALDKEKVGFCISELQLNCFQPLRRKLQKLHLDLSISNFLCLKGHTSLETVCWRSGWIY